MLRLFKQRFWQPPRAHGDVIEDRTVGFIELFFDLVFVVVISRAAHTLAEHPTWRGAGEFAAVFGMIWLAWLNGTVYQDIHGREDGRSRTLIFIQMMILAVLAVYTADAAGEDGRGFAIVYTALLVVLTYMWFSVRRLDSDEYMRITAQYLAGMAASVVVVAASALLPAGGRVVVWGLVVLGWVAGMMYIERFTAFEFGFAATDSTIERFGLFTIIVLGEVVVGVVTGLSEAERDTATVVTGIVGLMIGFGLWWTYFDFVGRRHPRTGWGMVTWTASHLPVTMAIVASGAGLVGLVEHGSDARSPTNAAWLISSAVALALVALIATMWSLTDFDRVPSIYRPLTRAMVAAAAISLLAGWWRPAPWALAVILVLVLSAVWWLAVDRWLRLPNPSDALPGGVQPDVG